MNFTVGMTGIESLLSLIGNGNSIVRCELPLIADGYVENYTTICEDDLKSPKTPTVVKEILTELISQRINGVTCDLGCGDGYIIRNIKNLPYKIAVDIALPYLESLPNDILKIHSAVESVPLGSHTIDSIICTDVLEHVLRPNDLALEIDRLLAWGGDLFLAFPYKQDLSVYDSPEYKAQCKQYKYVHLRSIDDALIDRLFPNYYIWHSEVITEGMDEMKFKPYPIKFVHMARKSNAR